MPEQIGVDVGFDWDSNVPEGAQDRWLMHGYPWERNPFNLHVGDKLFFTLYDVSDVGEGSVVPANLAVTFQAGDKSTTLNSPLQNGETRVNASWSTRAGKHASGVFPGGPFNSWYAQIPGIPPGSGGYSELTLANPGRYLYQVRVEIRAGGETRSFRFDPEFIIRR